MASIPVVGTTAITLAANATDPFTGLVISGNGNLYVSKSPSVSPTSYDKIIGPNGQFTYPPNGNPYSVYVCTDTGATLQMYYDNDGSTIDLGQLSISGPVGNYANATQLYDSGPIGIANALGTTPIAIPAIDVSKFASYRVLVLMTNNGGTILPANYIDCPIYDTAHATASDYPLQHTQWAYSQSNGCRLDAPVQSPSITFKTFGAIIGTLPGGTGTIRVIISGLNVYVPTPKYVMAGPGLAAGKPSGIAATENVAGTYYPESTNDPGILVVTPGNATGAVIATLNYLDAGTVTPLARTQSSAGANLNSVEQNFIAPMRPLQLVIGAITASIVGITVEQ